MPTSVPGPVNAVPGDSRHSWCCHVCSVASRDVSLRPDLRSADLSRPTGTVLLSDARGSHHTAPPRPTLRSRAQRHSVALACAATLIVHLLSLTRQLGPDEGGFAMVARYAGTGGPFLYGPEWVDRPPGLIGLFVFAGHLGPYGVRLTAAVLAVALVAALASAAEAVGGRSAARWAAWTGFAFGSSVLLQAQRLNGEIAAATFVGVSMAALVRALLVSSSRSQTALLGFLAGASATGAALMKQSFVDAFVFAGVLLLVGVATRPNRLIYRPPQVLATLAAFTTGAALPAAATLRWAHDHGGIGVLLYATLGFRADAAAVMAHGSWTAPLYRLGALAMFAWLSGLLFLIVHLAYSHRHRLRRPDPLPWAVATTAGVELLGVLVGANFWSHYLIALIPTVALAAGLSVNRRVPGARWTRLLVVLAVGVTALVSPIAAITAAHAPSAAYSTGRWVASSAHPDDTLVVPFSHANVIDAAHLRPGYPYAWSLPARTLDPHLELLTGTLNGPAAPTWVVRWDAADSWGLDPDDHVEAALQEHYRSVGPICGHSVWLHDGVSRHLALAPPASACGPGER